MGNPKQVRILPTIFLTKEPFNGVIMSKLEIKCPYCGELIWLEGQDNYFEIPQLISKFSNPYGTILECFKCNDVFLVREKIIRTFEVVGLPEPSFDIEETPDVVVKDSTRSG